MRKLFLIPFFVSSVYASGLKFQHKDTYDNQEFESVYQEINQKQDSRILTTDTSGQFLVGQGNGLNPAYQWSGRVGIPQVYTITSATSTTATSFRNTSLTGTITPLTAGSKIKISVSGACNPSLANTGNMTITRNGSNILGAEGAFRVINPSATDNIQFSCGFVYLDSPASASSVTYTVQMKSGAAGTFTFGESNTTSVMILEDYPQ
jgi:hypothetical protein